MRLPALLLAVVHQKYALGQLARSMSGRMTSSIGSGVRSLTPDQILVLVIQLLSMLQGCYPDPVQATGYVNSQRFFRTLRISRMARRLLRTAYPDYDDRVIENAVQEVLFQCKAVHTPEMMTYFSELERVRESASTLAPQQRGSAGAGR